MEIEELDKRRLAHIIASALTKNNGGPQEVNIDEVDLTSELRITIEGDELTILWNNTRVVAFTTWNYDGTWFAVVDIEKEELIMSCTDSDQFLPEDQLIIYGQKEGK